MADSSQDNSPTPRKTTGGGVFLFNGQQNLDIKSLDHVLTESPTLGVPPDPKSCDLATEQRQITTSHDPKPTINTHLSFGVARNSKTLNNDTSSKSASSRSTPDSLSYGSSDSFSEFQGNTDTTSTSFSSRGEQHRHTRPGAKRIENLDERDSISSLRAELIAAQAKVAQLSGKLAVNKSVSSDGSAAGDEDCDPQFGVEYTDFASADEAVASRGANVQGPSPALMEGSFPDHLIPPDSFRSVLRSPDSFGPGIASAPYQYPGLGHHGATSAHDARPYVPSGVTRGTVEAIGRPRFVNGWMETQSSSRSMTPISYNGTPVLSNGSSRGFHQIHAPMGQSSHGYSSLSPTAAEFPGITSSGFHDPTHAVFPARDRTPEGAMVDYGAPNYRRLLDRSVNCNWNFLVDKIVCNHDQQASIFLQQKIKTGTAEQKRNIIMAILDKAYPLMVNRFGNFLIQRCFEYGSPEQVIAMARAIRGRTVSLSMDPFGCHVVQKAFELAPEEYKAIMVHELLRCIPETVIHRYACHVWQKLFELKWNDSPPQIMKYVNEALKGMWHEVALGETGSLVVQNIFENCLEEDKRACVNEVMNSIDVIAHGQYGNWCIQHICEYGSVAVRTRAIEHILRFAKDYSVDQYASKVVEKCLKIGGTDFLDRYLEKICEAHPDRPRIPLIDISGDQFGNYLIQYILANADARRRELVAINIRRHMVSLRGSKYGSRVALLCSNQGHSSRHQASGGQLAIMDRPSSGAERGFSTRTNWASPRAGLYDRGY